MARTGSLSIRLSVVVLILHCGSHAWPSDRSRSPAAVRPVPQLMSADRERELRRLMPLIDDDDLQGVLEDPRLILYTDREMPPAYQHWVGQLQGVHSPDYNISAVNSEPFGNGNREFPWNAPAGTHRAQSVTSFHFLHLPRDDRGQTWPVVWYRKRLPGDVSVGYAWTFPVGTVLGEVLCIRSPAGRDYAFELRLRVREAAEWEVDVFRPFPNAKDLALRIRQLRADWEQNQSLVKLVRHLEEPLQMQERTLTDKQPIADGVFRERMGIDTLPPVNDDALVTALLTLTRFRSARGQVWRTSADGTFTCAPTTSARFHIVPAQYDGGFVEVDRVSCMRCHETANQHVTRFNAARDWYGRIRGSDGIFSFHPFDPASVSYNGFGTAVHMRRELTESGALAAYDAARHPRHIYCQIPDLPEGR